MKYTAPEMEIVMFETEEVMAASTTTKATTTADDVREDPDV